MLTYAQVHIWEERRVFGSRAQSLNDVMLGEELPPPLEFSKKRSRSVKIVRRDMRSIRTVRICAHPCFFFFILHFVEFLSFISLDTILFLAISVDIIVIFTSLRCLYSSLYV